MNVIKSPQKNIEAYLTNEVNIEVFEEYQNMNGKNRNEVLEYFNFLYSEFSFFSSNLENYLEIINHFDYSLHNPKIDFLTMGTTQKEESFQYYYALSKLINHYYPVNLREGVILSSCKHIESIYVLLNYNVGNDIMSNLLQEINSLDYEEKIQELLKMKYLSLQDENWFKDIRGVTLASKCDLEIERLGQLHQIKTIETTTTISTSHSEIFSNNGFELFEYLLTHIIKPTGTKGRFSDIAYYYWQMYNSEIQYIHQRPETFKRWFCKTYANEDIGKIKTADNVKNVDRAKHYSTALEWFKTQNK
jgi:hypothetical protein